LGPEIEKRLVKPSTLLRGHDSISKTLSSFRIEGTVGYVPCENSSHIGVDYGHASPEGKGSDGARGVGTDTGQSPKYSDVGGHFATKLFDEHLGRLMKILRSSMKAQSFPRSQHVGQRGPRAVPWGWKLNHESTPGFHDPTGLGLLEHEL
jgi:hypothetical protein